MLRVILSVILFLFLMTSFAQQKDVFSELDKAINKEWYYVQIKEQRIDSLKSLLQQKTFIHNQKEQYQLYRRIADEYTVYVFDSAMCYYRKAIDMAYNVNNPASIAQTLSNYGHLLVSVGYYKEAIDTLNKVDIEQLKGEDIQEYYSYKVRAYYDLADYIKDDFYSPQYRQIANAYVDSVSKYAVEGTIKPVLTKALYYLVNWKPDSSSFYFKYAYDNLSPDLHQQAVIHSSLGFIDVEEGRRNSGIEHLVNSAIADIKTVTKEATSLRVLSRYLYQDGEVQKAYKYVQQAKKDADFFGSKQRILEVSEIFPAIEGAKLIEEERKKETAFKYAWIVSLLIVGVLLFLIIVYRQLFNLRKIWISITKSNKELKVLNTQLNEANRIKEKYIGHFFNTSSGYINKLEEISKALNKLLSSNNPVKLKTVLKKINPRKEREQLFHNFDEVFLSLFPDFIKEVDSFILPENKYVLKSGQLLNTELRILALIRLGIIDNETIAQVLDVSINTIYTYKTKAKNKSDLSAEDFFKRLNDIKTVV
ncbi:DUF6377 domain-containing protein [Plebeiibacterium sediminum]|uniref:DUF6377 domain-containing protein n=1 Tax=Plebeiibacterium sediminum TaxID=2992112 RepID=A0AAE3M2K3_9BACT|nr:DUF6377 domain-containing protein [Plebeiobacterium sediminum]MCW3785929.1 DUF6377 domain-containing protein [Plebeiobacterium sediminum]